MGFDDVRQSQGYYLGSQRDVAATAAKTLTATLMTPSWLMDLVIQSDQLFVVTGLNVAGQPLIVTDQAVDGSMFAPQGYYEGHKSIGIPLDKTQQVGINLTLAANGQAQFGIGTDPIEPGEDGTVRVVPTNNLGDALCYCGGFSAQNTTTGLVTVPLGGGAGIQTFSTIRKRCKIGRMTLLARTNPLDIEVQSIQVNNDEMLSGGPTNATRGIPGTCLSNIATDQDGLSLGVEVGPNDTVTMTLVNNNAANVIVSAGFFCLPMGRRQ